MRRVSSLAILIVVLVLTAAPFVQAATTSHHAVTLAVSSAYVHGSASHQVDSISSGDVPERSWIKRNWLFRLVVTILDDMSIPPGNH